MAKSVRAPAQPHLLRGWGKQIGLRLVEQFGYNHLTAARRHPWDQHDGVELILVVDGEVQWELDDGRTYTMVGGQLSVMPPRTRHRARGDVYAPCTMFWVMYRPFTAKNLANSVFTSADLPTIRSLGGETTSLYDSSARLLDACSAFRRLLQASKSRAAKLSEHIIGIKLYAPDGRLEGELRLVGLFTSGAYTRSARQIPYVRHKVAQVLQRAGFDPDGHSGKAVLHILEEYPRDELFQVDAETLYTFVMEILMLHERPRVRALARSDKFDRFVSIITFIPREKYDTDVRTRVATFLAQVYKGTLAASYVSFPEGPLARVHYIIGRYEGKTPVVERATLEAEITAIAATWGDKLRAALAASTDGMRARMLANRYAQAFTGGYTEIFGTSQATADIATIEKLTPARSVAISVQSIEARTIRRASASRSSRVARRCRCPIGCR